MKIISFQFFVHALEFLRARINIPIISISVGHFCIFLIHFSCVSNSTKNSTTFIYKINWLCYLHTTLHDHSLLLFFISIFAFYFFILLNVLFCFSHLQLFSFVYFHFFTIFFCLFYFVVLFHFLILKNIICIFSMPMFKRLQLLKQNLKSDEKIKIYFSLQFVFIYFADFSLEFRCANQNCIHVMCTYWKWSSQQPRNSNERKKKHSQSHTARRNQIKKKEKTSHCIY